jgi:hypothetical protein
MVALSAAYSKQTDASAETYTWGILESFSSPTFRHLEEELCKGEGDLATTLTASGLAL